MSIRGGADVYCGSWKQLDETVMYTSDNLQSFKKDFFKVMDFYLSRIHECYERVSISISGGMDSNTIAAEYARLYPSDDTCFLTSRIPDVTDESKMAAHMQKVLPRNIEYIPIAFDEQDLLVSLDEYLSNHVPPRFFNLLSEVQYIKLLKQKTGSGRLYISGMEADGLLGGFGGEYMYFARECLKKGEYKRAKDVFTANQISFAGVTDNTKITKNFWKWCVREKIKTLAVKLGYQKRKPIYNEQKLLRVNLPERESYRVRSHKEALAYQAFGDGALHDTNIIYEEMGLACVYPYGGYKFLELSAHCDPFIFSDKVNKSCLRKITKGLLPDEIINNVVKKGQPGLTLTKVLQQKNNAEKIAAYLECHKNSTLVNERVLLQNLRAGKFDKKEFCALALIMFEDQINKKYGKVIDKCV